MAGLILLFLSLFLGTVLGLVVSHWFFFLYLVALIPLAATWAENSKPWYMR